jgi:succinate dehydrogenase / fumarate reductase cytochrome b subunit
MAFLVVHLCLNATIFAADDGRLFNQTAELLNHSWWLHGLELLVFSSLILHIGQGVRLTGQNRSKRNTAYAVNPPLTLDASRFMGVLGAIILVFLVLHLYQFWLPHILGTAVTKAGLYQLMTSTLQQWWVLVVYVVGCGAVAAHLSHGWRSAAITFGIGIDAAAHRDRPLVQLLSILGISCAILVPLGLATIPIWLFTIGLSHA